MRLWRKLVNQDCLEILDTRWYKIKHEYGGELLLLLFFFCHVRWACGGEKQR